MENGLKELQQRLVEMLSSFQKFTQQNGMIFFLVGGSALGAVRHQGFIPWDDDVDIAMMREDFEKMEYLMSLQHDRLGEFIYSPVEKHMIPDAPIGYLYDTLHADAGYENHRYHGKLRKDQREVLSEDTAGGPLQRADDAGEFQHAHGRGSDDPGTSAAGP